MGRPRALSKEEEREALNLYEKYENARQVANFFECSDQTIYRILKKYGIPRTHRHEKARKREPFPSNCKTKYCPAVIVMLYSIGKYTTSDISHSMNIPISSVDNTLRRRCGDAFISKQDASRNADIDAIEREYLAGASTYELSEKFGVYHSTISKWMRKRGHVRGRGRGAAVTARNARRHEKAVTDFISRYPDEVLSAEKSDRRCAIRRRYRIVSRPHDGPIEGLSWRDIAAHNGGNLKCWICGKECDPNDNGDMRPSIDHVVPLSNGGTDTYDNTRIACFGCNRDRNNRVQLTLDYLMYEMR